MPASARLRALFDPDAWEQDLARSTNVGRAAAQTARRRYENNGVPIDELQPCSPEGRDNTRLGGCVKAYLPPPAGRFGIVFLGERDDQGPVLQFLAFGVRHHPRGAHALTVYQLAHRRLHSHP